jgi:hypothetical protein
MKHFQAPFQGMSRIETLIANLNRSVEILNVDIETEEERARVTDVSDPAYPIIARQLRARRDNLQTTITALQEHLQKEGPSGKEGFGESAGLNGRF